MAAKPDLLLETFLLKDLPHVAGELIGHMGEKTLILLAGEVGAGKTTLINEVCLQLQFTETASPSFAILHRYENRLNQSMDHVDLYRLKDEADLESTGFWDLFQQTQAWIMVEWSDRITAEAWPLNWPTIQIELEKLDGDLRRIRITRVR